MLKPPCSFGPSLYIERYHFKTLENNKYINAYNFWLVEPKQAQEDSPHYKEVETVLNMVASTKNNAPPDFHKMHLFGQRSITTKRDGRENKAVALRHIQQLYFIETPDAKNKKIPAEGDPKYWFAKDYSAEILYDKKILDTPIQNVELKDQVSESCHENLIKAHKFLNTFPNRNFFTNNYTILDEIKTVFKPEDLVGEFIDQGNFYKALWFLEMHEKDFLFSTGPGKVNATHFSKPNTSANKTGTSAVDASDKKLVNQTWVNYANQIFIGLKDIDSLKALKSITKNLVNGEQQINSLLAQNHYHQVLQECKDYVNLKARMPADFSNSGLFTKNNAIHSKKSDFIAEILYWESGWKWGSFSRSLLSLIFSSSETKCRVENGWVYVSLIFRNAHSCPAYFIQHFDSIHVLKYKNKKACILFYREKIQQKRIYHI